MRCQSINLSTSLDSHELVDDNEYMNTGGLLVKLAQQEAEEYVRAGIRITIPPSLPAELSLQRACYVYIYERPGRRLRAMHGGPLPKFPSLAQEVVRHVIDAIQLQQTSPVGLLDLKNLSYCVAVLGPLQRITVHEHLDPNNYGLYIKSDQDRSAAVLPQRTGVNT